MDNKTISIILVVVITTLFFLIHWRMSKFSKNVADITRQIAEARKRDRVFKSQEFQHYFLANGMIWLSLMDPMFKKSLMSKSIVSVLGLVVSVLMMGVCYASEVIPLAVYPVLLFGYILHVGINFDWFKADDKKYTALALKHYQSAYPEDPTVKQGKAGEKAQMWYVSAKQAAQKTGRLGRGTKEEAAKAAKAKGKGNPEEPTPVNRAQRRMQQRQQRRHR